MKVAEFKIKNVEGVVVDQYYLPYESAKELNDLVAEARQVWDEFYVEIETEFFVQSFSHTYKQEQQLNCSVVK